MQQIKHLLANRTPGILDDQQGVRTAVLLPLVRHEQTLSLLFEVRSHEMRGQPGEICFPGGHMDQGDLHPLDTALRETSEELGITRSSIETLGPLDTLVTPFQLIIYPHVGLIRPDTPISPNPREVQEVFFVPLDYLFNTSPVLSHLRVRMKPQADFPFQLLPNGENYQWKEGRYPVYFYQYRHYRIWGLTARILHHFLELIRNNALL